MRGQLYVTQKFFCHEVQSVALLWASRPLTKVASVVNRTQSGTTGDPTMSQKVWLVQTVTALPTKTVAGRRSVFFLSHSRTQMRHLTLMARDIMKVLPQQPFKVSIRSFGDKPAHPCKQTALGVAVLPSAHIVTVSPASSGMAEAAMWREIGSEGTLSRDKTKK